MRFQRLKVRLVLLFAMAVSAHAEDNAKPFAWLDYRYVIKILNSGTYEQPASSSLNPNNDVLQLPRYSLDNQTRLDLNANAGPVSLSIKPRFTYDWSKWSQGVRSGDSDSQSDLYINEWQLQLSIVDKVFVAVGRENLQWGPAYLYSPSNPFFQDNGQTNPKREVPGMDFVKVLWIPKKPWAVNLIANVGEGRAEINRNIDNKYNQFVEGVNAGAQKAFDSIDQAYQQGIDQINAVRSIARGPGPISRYITAQADALAASATQQRDAGIGEVNRQSALILQEAATERDTYDRNFHDNYAVKLDYSTIEKYATLIASYQTTDHREDIKRLRLGSYAGWTASDALILYTEEAISLRGNELYPINDPTSPFGQRLAPTRQTSDDFKGAAVAGGTYTLIGGQTIVAEYLFNGNGYNGAQADSYYKLRGEAVDALNQPEPLATLGLITLGEAVDPGLRFLRQNYLLLQYQQGLIVGDLSAAVRATINLDDRSVQLIPILSYSLNDHWQLFAIMNQNLGPKNTEFTSYIDSTYQFGAELDF